MTATGRIGAARLTGLLGAWRSRPDRPTAVDLSAAVRVLALDGRLPPGTRLPSERELAAATGTSRTLVTAAYDQLRAEGLLASRRGAGSWTTVPDGTRGRWRPPSDDPADLIDLAHATPPAPPGLAAALDVARCAITARLSGHGYSPHGLPELRARLADRYTARGLPTTAEQIIVTNGAQHAFALALRLLTTPGDRVLVEHPTYPNAVDAIHAVHARPVAVPVDHDGVGGGGGWDVAGIDAALRRSRPAVAYLVPDFQNPTGLRMSESVRAQVGRALQATRTPVVVDETLLELALDPGPAVSPLAAHVGDLAITTGSASKTFWGGLRLGWLRAPVEVIDRLVAGRGAIDLGCPIFEQLALVDLLDRRAELVAGLLTDLRAQRDALRAAVARELPGWTVNRPAGGLALWCRLDAPAASRLTAHAIGHGLRLVPGARFSAHGGLEDRLRLPYTLPVDVLDDAVVRLAAAWRECRGGVGGPTLAAATVA